MNATNLCGKTVFTTADAAEKRAARLTKKNEENKLKTRLRHYQCAACGYYHLTSQTKSKYLRTVEAFVRPSLAASKEISLDSFKEEFPAYFLTSVPGATPWSGNMETYYSKYKTDFHPRFTIAEWVEFWFIPYKLSTHEFQLKSKTLNQIR